MDLTTISDPVDPVAAAALALHERIGHLDAEDLADAKHWAAKPALNRPLGTGEPL